MHDPRYNPTIPSHVPASLVHDHNVLDYETQDPFQAVNALFEGGVPEIFWTRNCGGHWLVMGTEAITGVTADPSHFSSKQISNPEHWDSYSPYFPPVDTDPPLHTAYRTAIAPLFLPPRVELMKERIRELTRTLIGEIKKRGECEFMEDFAAQMPVIVFLQLLDLPEGDRAKLRAIVLRVVSSTNYEEAAVPFQQLSEYLLPVIKSRMAKPGEDSLSHIATQRINDRPIELDEIVKLARTLVVGGLDTTSGMLGYFARYLADMPAARRQLIEQPEMIGKAIEEILRRYPVTNLGRYVTKDVVYRGVQMKAGDHVMCPIAMFNFDKHRFPNALSVQFDRTGNRHAAFGAGIHTCVGSVLARAELRIFAEEWLPAIPDFHLKPGAKIEYRAGSTVIYKTLPIVLGAKSAP
jgi:cytochrome P450